MSLAITEQESYAKRKEHVLDALYYRRKKQRKVMQSCLTLARLEWINQRYFLGEQPF
ncbi:Uncharacterised protein [Yersinia pseudotuberculosis]|uniref:hypothetical protein n=1 Tax=Yersinia pseudotuberculosis TaxID=633 RepID=UPI0005EA37BA|nr:hypothetical protein [Yersinia pseudotuberculosis]CFV22145.1 Uncharacterised protein [Yersinia pseudotuberculosis]CNH74755.1 Uncharacterised protein [Yersinia pseudotuberculosis]